MERFIRGEFYVVVKPKDWDAFAAMCDMAGLGWGDRKKVSERTPAPLTQGKPIRLIALADGVRWAPVNTPRSLDFPVLGFKNLKPLAKQANGAGIVSNGITVTARLFAGADTVNTAKATCSPDDTFRFGPGALLAMFRALETEEDRMLAMDLIGNERIKQLEPEIPNIRDLVRGKKNMADADKLGGMLAEALSNVFGTQVVVIRQGESHPGKTAFLRMVENAVQTAAAEGAKQ